MTAATPAIVSTGWAASQLSADPKRVVTRLFLPGEGVASTHSRAAEIVERVLAIPAEQITRMAEQLSADFAARHGEVGDVFTTNARAVGSRVSGTTPVDAERALVLGATFTAEYAVEGAALCNPSAVAHPDQTGMAVGQLRVAVALRAIGEGHLSSIAFAEAVIGPDDWAFQSRTLPLATAAVTQGDWSREHLRAALEHEGHLNETSSALLGALPEQFTTSTVDAALLTLPESLTRRRDTMTSLETLRNMVSSAYRAEFTTSTSLSQRVLLPAAAEEDHGMEDARFVRFVGADGRVEYRATYTAYDGRDIAPRLITSPDLRRFSIHRLTGPAARNKGMALFPRLIGGAHFALTRTDGESISLAHSADGLAWDDQSVIHSPTQPWELVQTGNCGSPLETAAGWLVLTHGVGPMRTYSIGALLLYLADPSRVIARTVLPIMQPTAQTRDGYVPNVLYSCGGIVHDGVLWVPYGIGDNRVSVFSVPVDELIASMELQD